MANFFDQFDAAPASPPPKAGGGNFFDQYDQAGAKKEKKETTFSDRLQDVWDKPTPGSVFWLAKQAVEGVKGAVDSAKVANMTPQTEEEAAAVNQAREALPGYAMQAASVLSPGAPEGAGGALAVPVARAAAPAAAPVSREAAVPVVEAARRLSDVTGSDITIPRAVASDNIAVQRSGQAIRNLPIVGDRIPQATQSLVENLETATGDVADQFGTGSGPNVANRVGRTITDAADLETRTATDAARRSDEALAAAHQRDIDAAHADVANRETMALQAARQAVGDMSPQDMGAALIGRLRTEETAARANKDALYDIAGRSDASIHAAEVSNVRAHVAQGLEDAGIIVDPGSAASPSTTPAANRMMNVLQDLADLRIGNSAVGTRTPATGTETPVAVSAQGLEQARKRLVFARSAATNDADRRAATQIMRQFEDWQSHAFENALYSGSDEALNAFRAARAANTAWRNRFFNEENDAGRVINSIVTGERTPQEVANYIIGAGKVGASGVSSRLIDAIDEATGNSPEALQAINGAIWNRLSQSTEGTAAKSPAAIAKDITEFLNGSGRDVAERRFTPDQRRIMRAYADTLRNGEAARQLIGDVAAATKPSAMDVQPGPMKQLADQVIGKGGKSDEALFRAIDSYAKSGNRADVATLAKLVQALPQEERANLAGAIIRNLGVSPRTGQFSPDVFVSQWNNYTPQAKAVLFGNAGAQRHAIDDIALISDRLKQIGSKFGNPSGTAQNLAPYALASALFTAPIATIAAGIGGFATARVLAAPAGAASAAKWSRAYSQLLLQQSPKAVALFKVASRNLANTAQSLGIKFSPNDLARALQGPVQSRAEDEKT